MKHTIHYTENRLAPTRQCELDEANILCNDIVLPGENHPHKVRLWVIGHEFGAVCAVWADCEQDALDEAVDAGLMESFLVPDDDQKDMTKEEIEELAALGNAGELHDLSTCWMAEASFDIARDYKLLFAFAEARGACRDTLDK